VQVKTPRVSEDLKVLAPGYTVPLGSADKSNRRRRKSTEVNIS